jgi:hypothetical protein
MLLNFHSCWRSRGQRPAMCLQSIQSTAVNYTQHMSFPADRVAEIDCVGLCAIHVGRLLARPRSPECPTGSDSSTCFTERRAINLAKVFWSLYCDAEHVSLSSKLDPPGLWHSGLRSSSPGRIDSMKLTPSSCFVDCHPSFPSCQHCPCTP